MSIICLIYTSFVLPSFTVTSKHHPYKRAYSYIRFSSKKQEQGDSLRRQLKAAQAFCDEFEIPLDSSNWRDLGLPAFRGQNLNHEGKLKAFIQECKNGNIPPDSVLIVENLDRLSRQGLLDAVQLFLELIKHIAIGVAQYPFKIYSRNSLAESSFSFFEIQMAFIRANEESAAKSRRLRAAWENKKNNASTKILTPISPAWMMLSADKSKFILLQDRVAIVKEIFDMCVKKNMGTYAITRTLNERRVKPWGRAKQWHESYIKKILRSEGVCGVYVQYSIDEITGKRIPNGVSVKDYYPRIISDTMFGAAESAIQGRIRKGGRKGGTKDKGVRTLFTDLLVDAYTGGPVHFINKGKWHYLVPSFCRTRAVQYYMSWEYEQFESEMLKFIFLDNNIAPQFMKVDEVDQYKHDELKRELQDISVKIQNLSDAVADFGYSEDLKAKLAKLEGEKREKQTALHSIQHKIASSVTNLSVEDFAFSPDLGDKIRKDEDLRTRYYSVMRERIQEMKVYFEGDDMHYIRNRENIQQAMTVVGRVQWKKLVSIMKLLHFVKITYRNGDSMFCYVHDDVCKAEEKRLDMLEDKNTREDIREYLERLGDVTERLY